MKKLIIIFALAFVSQIEAQFRSNLDRQGNRTTKPVEHEQKENHSEALKNYREKILLDELNLNDQNSDKFVNMFDDYHKNQTEIKSYFRINLDPDKLSDTEARRKLTESFILGQKLLDNKKEFSEKLKLILTPQQILKFFQNEGQIRDKVISKHLEQN